MSIESRLREGLARNGEVVPADAEASLDRVISRRRASLRRRAAVVAVAAAVALAMLAPSMLDRLGRHDDGLAPVAPPSTVAELVGTYVLDVPASGRSGLAGRWTMTLEPGGRLTVDPPLGQEARAGTASYVVRDGVLATNALLDSDCQRPGATVVGRYTWTRRDDRLLFSLVRDGCAVRRALFETPWEEQR